MKKRHTWPGPRRTAPPNGGPPQFNMSGARTKKLLEVAQALGRDPSGVLDMALGMFFSEAKRIYDLVPIGMALAQIDGGGVAGVGPPPCDESIEGKPCGKPATVMVQGVGVRCDEHAPHEEESTETAEERLARLREMAASPSPAAAPPEPGDNAHEITPSDAGAPVEGDEEP